VKTGIELNCLEASIGVLARGIRTTHDQEWIVASAWAGRKSKLGDAIHHFLGHQNERNAQLVVSMLAKELTAQKVCKAKESVDVANDAMAAWFDWACPACTGTGVLSFAQEPCPYCGGTGERPRVLPEHIYHAMAIINAALADKEVKMRRAVAW
jgi:hypothetical protein